MTIATNENFERLCRFVDAKADFMARTGNNEKYREFLNLYPAGNIKSLTLDEYCLGKNAIEGNFCWWVERGLEKVLGRYMPGTSRGHLMYKKPEDEIYINKQLQHLGTEEALKYITKIHGVIAEADPSEGLEWIDSDAEIHRRAGTDPIITMGDGRKLRMLSVYHLDSTLPIASSDHVRHFLEQLGCQQEDIPDDDHPVARVMLLKQYYELAKNDYNSDLSPYGFVKALYADDMNLRPVKENKVEEEEVQYSTLTDPDYLPNKNQILFGPPGTGKTFSTVSMAVKICEPELYFDYYDDSEWDEFYSNVKSTYDELVDSGRIVFTTFHQSFSYEDFIEGIRAEIDETTKSLSYDVQDGVFKELCDAAETRVTKGSNERIELDGRRVWKMSLGNTLEDDDSIYQECLENNYVALGYGGPIDFTGCNNRDAIKQKLIDEKDQEISNNDYTLTSVHTIKNVIKPGDLIIISDGNRKFRAIAEVTGEYEYLNTDERQNYQQIRPVVWHKVFEPSKQADTLFKKSLSQMTLYELKSKTLDFDKLENLLAPASEQEDKVLPYVIIIDEINRGNVSRIFGELITLIEENKRKGQPESRSVILPYSKKPFSVPDNVYLIGTMNTADKSLAQLDLALRRRFTFSEVLPNPDLLEETKVYGFKVAELLSIINQRIEVLLDRDHLIGHSYLMPLMSIENESDKQEKLSEIFRDRLIPLLQEYFFDDWERITWVLNDPEKSPEDRFIVQGGENKVPNLFSSSISNQIKDRRFSINDSAFDKAEAFKGIF